MTSPSRVLMIGCIVSLSWFPVLTLLGVDVAIRVIIVREQAITLERLTFIVLRKSCIILATGSSWRVPVMWPPQRRGLSQVTSTFCMAAIDPTQASLAASIDYWSGCGLLNRPPVRDLGHRFGLLDWLRTALFVVSSIDNYFLLSGLVESILFGSERPSGLLWSFLCLS